ncbi:MAG: uracil-DNA glycosylase family protein [Acidobacteriota bacterium]
MDEAEKSRRLADLYEEIQRDPRYRNENMGTVFVAGRGDFGGNPVVFIGEAPGRDEEKAQAPFVGAAGRNLNALLTEIGLARERVYITNLVKYRPMSPTGDNRAPTPKESRYALPYLLRELEILSPRLVVCLGLSSAKALLEDPTLKMGEANGAFFDKNGIKVLVTYHPSPYNYKIPEKQKAMREAFERLREVV